MRAFLVRTPWEKLHLGFKGLVTMEPLQLEYLATSVHGLADVHLFDLWFERDAKLLEAATQLRPELVAMSVSAVQIYSARRIAAEIKRVSPGTLVVVGGDAPTLTPGFFSGSEIDVLCVGHGLEAFREIATRIQGNGDPLSVPNTIAVVEGKLRENPRHPRCSDVDLFGLPDRTLSAPYRHRFHFYHHRPIASTVFSTGCWNRCSFCTTWMKNGTGAIGRRSPENVAADLERVREKWVFVADDDVFFKGHRVPEILERLERQGRARQYVVEATADDILRNRGTVEKWARLGLRQVLIGLESPFDAELRQVEKAATVATNKEAIAFLRKLGVDTIASFILFPDWTKSHFDALWRFVKEQRLFWVHFQCFTPYPGTKAYRDALGQIRSHNLDLLDMEHMVLQTKDDLADWYSNRLWLQLKAGNPLRGFDREVRRRVPVNPLHSLYRAYARFLWGLYRAIHHHEVPGEPWQPRSPEEISAPGPSLQLQRLPPYKQLGTDGMAIDAPSDLAS